MTYKQDKYPLYLRAYGRELRKRMEEEEKGKEERSTLLRVVFYGINTTILTPKSTNYDETMMEFQSISALKDIIAKLTPSEFMNLFPISKTYDGDCYEIKDYFYTLDYINSMNAHEPIGEKTLEFLMEYTNPHINVFNVKGVMCVSDLRQYDGHLDLMEEFMAADGNDTPNTFKNGKGKAMYVRNGKPALVEQIKTDKLKLIK